MSAKLFIKSQPVKKVVSGSIKIGTTFNMPYADGNPLWTVVSVYSKVKKTFVCEVLKDPDWKGQQKIMAVPEIKRMLVIENFWSDMLAKHNKEWFTRIKENNLKPGDFVHEISDFERGNKVQIIRNVLQKDGSLLAIGVLNAKSADHFWIGSDFDGKIKMELGYLAERINSKESKVWDNRISDFVELTRSNDINFKYRKVDFSKKTLNTLKVPVLTSDMRNLVEFKNKLDAVTNILPSIENSKEQIKKIKKEILQLLKKY